MAQGFKHGGGGMPTSGIPQIAFTGEYQEIVESKDNWHVELLTSGNLNFQKLKNAANGIEVCLVGAGNSGGSGDGSGGGNGGNGGAVRTENVIPLANTDYTIIIGGSNGATSAFGYTASPGGGGSGGRAGWTSGASPNGYPGSDGTHAFGDTAYPRYGAGGGGGAGAWDGAYGRPGLGGDYGGGNGGGKDASGATGKANTGGGGGGGGCTTGGGGAGGSGIVIIRNKRS